jgi:hypothetical protein
MQGGVERTRHVVFVNFTRKLPKSYVQGTHTCAKEHIESDGNIPCANAMHTIPDVIEKLRQ